MIKSFSASPIAFHEYLRRKIKTSWRNKLLIKKKNSHYIRDIELHNLQDLRFFVIIILNSIDAEVSLSRHISNKHSIDIIIYLESTCVNIIYFVGELNVQFVSFVELILFLYLQACLLLFMGNYFIIILYLRLKYHYN